MLWAKEVAQCKTRKSPEWLFLSIFIISYWRSKTDNITESDYSEGWLLTKKGRARSLRPLDEFFIVMCRLREGTVLPCRCHCHCQTLDLSQRLAECLSVFPAQLKSKSYCAFSCSARNYSISRFIHIQTFCVYKQNVEKCSEVSMAWSIPCGSEGRVTLLSVT